ncbi:MAG: hypothetical protein ABI304_08790 [Rudaea sp.]
MKAIRVVMLLSWPLVAFCAAFTPRESNAQTPSILGAVTTQVTTGSGHTCALTTTGAVLCWGSNAYGVLGNNSTSQSNVAVPVSGLDSGVVAITAGADHTCALTTAGAVLCWGYNFFGDLGNNSNANSYVPVPVSNLSTGVVAITAGYDHTCALTTLGAVLCWGHNGTGQLGNNSTTDSHVPVPAVARYFGGAVAAITAGFGHTCALTTTGAVKCFGFDGTGALGNNSTTDSPIPVGVSGLDSGVAAIAAGATHTCALTTTGAMQCWGSNGNGQVGNNATTDSHVPVPVSTLTSGVMAITSGYVHTCALTTAGAMKCWGANSNGELGNNSITDSHVPTPVSSLANGVASIASGSSADHSCALTTQGVVFCWGSNSYGELGNNSTTESHVPTAVSDIGRGVASITAGDLHTCAVTTAGGVKCWGANFNGQLGNNMPTVNPVPESVDVSGLPSGVATAAAGAYHTCALTTTGAVQCWGYNSSGQLGNGSKMDSSSPVAVSNLTSGVVAISAGAYHNCALTSSHGVQCWGNNQYGGLGNASTVGSTTPVDVSGLTSGVSAIVAGVYHTCALLTSTGGVKCWGYNHYGQLGNASTTNTSTPVDVTGLTGGVLAITAGPNHTCALTTTGAVKCWGDNQYGQLGNNSMAVSTVPVNVSTLSSGVSAIVSGLGADNTCALIGAGAMKCWGRNDFGQLGDGSTTNRLVPVAVNTLASGVIAVATGAGQTCALTSAGTLLCWGRNNYGQIGEGSTTPRLTPVSIGTSQSIAFNQSLAAAMGESLHLFATSTSGRAVSFETWTPSTCSISGNVLTISPNAPEQAQCGVRASQPGGTRAAGGSDAPASQQLRLIRISEFIFSDGFEYLGVQ